MFIETERLIIREFDRNMAESVHLNSLDEDNRRFMADEVFETVEEARQAIEELINAYGHLDAPQVYPVLLKDGRQIGHVEMVPIIDYFEIGYHIGKPYVVQGYASEAVKAFLPVILDIMRIHEISGICLADNIASRRVLEKCGFVMIFDGIGPYHGQEMHICRYRYNKVDE